MSSVTLDDFMALNDQLAALVRAGVPLDVDLGQSGTDVTGTLEKINASIARRVSRGDTLPDAIAAETSVVTPSYRCLVQLGLQNGNLATALVGSHRLAESVVESWHALRLSLLYPAVVVGVAYLGIVGFCLFFLPTLEGMYQTMHIPVGSGLRLLRALRSSLPYWVAIPPLMLLLAIAWSRFATDRLLSLSPIARCMTWLPGMSAALFQLHCANFAENLATLLDRETPLDEALSIAAGTWDNPTLAAETRALAKTVQEGQRLSDDCPLATRLPPFLRWALCRSEAIGRAPALRMAASIYRDSAIRRLQRIRVVTPLVLCAVLGGGITLLYGLTLFVPVVDMLRGLAS
jgi:type II secretory pathway component PulF